MKTINCHGHEKPITKIKYNLEGDLLFSIAKDTFPCVWFSLNGERLGTYNGHNGAVYGFDVKWDTTQIITGSADKTSILWDAELGKAISKMDFQSTVRSVNFNLDGSRLLLTTQQQKDRPSQVYIINVNEFGKKDSLDSQTSFDMTGKPNVTNALWGPLDEYIITTHSDGSINQWDLKNELCINFASEHKQEINDIQASADQIYFVTASSDFTAKLYDFDTLQCMKTYKASRKINSASISPIYRHCEFELFEGMYRSRMNQNCKWYYCINFVKVALGGGEDVRQVTRSGDKGGFESRFYHLVYEEEFARVPGHFGPINSLVFHPDGKSFSTGGEDGIIKINYFDQSYFNFKM